MIINVFVRNLISLWNEIKSTPKFIKSINVNKIMSRSTIIVKGTTCFAGSYSYQSISYELKYSLRYLSKRVREKSRLAIIIAYWYLVEYASFLKMKVVVSCSSCTTWTSTRLNRVTVSHIRYTKTSFVNCFNTYQSERYY